MSEEYQPVLCSHCQRIYYETHNDAIHRIQRDGCAHCAQYMRKTRIETLYHEYHPTLATLKPGRKAK